MKKNTYAIIIFIAILFVLLAGCSKTAAETPAPADTAAPTQTAAATEAPLPTETAAPTPTATPEPIPCTIVFESDRDGNWEIYRMNPDGSGAQNLSNDSADDLEPAFSADGRQIAFSSNREVNGEGGLFIYIMDADGSNLRRLDSSDGGRNPVWSPAGDAIVYDNAEDLFMIKADGSEPPVNLTNSPELDWRADWFGDQIAWLSGEDGNWNIKVLDLPSGQIQQLTDNGKANDVQWTVDGQLFTHWGDNEVGCSNCVMDADGSNLADAGGKGTIQQYLPFFTENGDRVECVGGNIDGGDDEIFLVGEIYPDIFLNLTNNDAHDRNPDWPDKCGPVSMAQEEEPQEQAAQPLPAGDMRIGYENSSGMMTELKETDLLAACQELQVECVYGDDIPSLMEQDVDAIISFSNRWHVSGSWPMFHEATTRGILLIVLDAETGEQGAYNLSIESDAIRAGLDWMFTEMGGEGELVYYNFGPSDLHQTLIDQALKENPGIQATAMPASYEDESMSEADIAELVAANPNIEAIWANAWQNNVFWGLHNSQLKNPPLMLLEPRADNFQYWQDWMNENSSVRCFSTIMPGGTAYEGVYAAYYILSGLTIDPEALGGDNGNTFKYDYPVITNENLEKWLGGTPDSVREGQWNVFEMIPMQPDEIREAWFLD